MGDHAGAVFLQELALAASDVDGGIKVGGGLIKIGGMAVGSALAGCRSGMSRKTI